MNVVFKCLFCREALTADEQVISVSREVPMENTGTLDVQYRTDQGYVHPAHEKAATLRGYRRRATGTLIELEVQRNPNLYE
jgi:hypothetical protein